MAGILKSTGANKKINITRTNFAVIVSEWNSEITEALYHGTYTTLIQLGAIKSRIIRKNVPGSYELPLGAQEIVKLKKIDAIICLGCVIQGETPHFNYICTSVSNGILNVSLALKKPISFGVITALNYKQALERAGGELGNKGEEAALAVVKMLNFSATDNP